MIRADRRALLQCADAEKLERTKRDLERLYIILNDTHFDSMMTALMQFISAKGQYCLDDIVPRFNKYSG